MKNGKRIDIWLQMTGFEKNDPDRGAARYIDSIGFTPDAVCPLIFHPDFIHYHKGMEKEYGLLRANCAYYGVERTTERERQDWTNYDLRTLISSLKARGVDTYAGIMGIYLNDKFHREFLSEHPELRYLRRDGTMGGLHCLKRFADGSYYEDFFIEKAVKTLTDFGFAGIHLADGFVPTARRYVADWSRDMLDQFTAHTGIAVPEEGAAEFVWNDHRLEWLRFYEWRWTRFFEKLCKAFHAAGLQVWTLGIYCTDPIENMYINGINVRKLADVGVDRFTANILPTSVGLGSPDGIRFYHRIQLDLPYMRAQVRDTAIDSILSIHDCSEEWTVIGHRPVELEKDLYTMTAFEGAADGLFLCLGDGVRKRDWEFLHERFDTALRSEKTESVSPLILWSDGEYEAEFEQYVACRRPSSHRMATLIFKAGYPFGGAVRFEKAMERKAPLFVPNFDLYSEDEKKALAARRLPWVGTCPADCPLDLPALTFECVDGRGDRPTKAFVCGFELTEAQKAEILRLCGEDDGEPSTLCEPERELNALYDELPFAKLGSGFIKACGLMLTAPVPFRADVPLLAIRGENAVRLYVYNDKEHCYSKGNVTSDVALTEVKTVTPFPVLPVKLTDGGHAFEVKLPPNGVTIVDVK